MYLSYFHMKEVIGVFVKLSGIIVHTSNKIVE